MKRRRMVLPIVGLCVFILIGALGCKTNEAVEPHPAGVLVQSQGCKQQSVANMWFGTAISGNEGCLEYNYDGSTLRLKHINAGFNCCPGEITADIVIQGNVISISEKEGQAGCFCQCLFDLDFEVVDLVPGVYTVIIHEPYLKGNDQAFEYNMDLKACASGLLCLQRSHYPWVD